MAYDEIARTMAGGETCRFTALEVCIPAEHADLQVFVGPEAVWLGFFASDGQLTILDIEGLSRGDSVDQGRLSALAAWARDRREQAKAKRS